MANDISTSFNDREIFFTQPNWGKDITSKISIQRRSLGQLGGVKTINQLITDAPITVSSDFTLNDRESIYNLLDFFNSRRGETESFWFLHPARFFTLKETYNSGSDYLIVDRNYGDKWTQALSSQYDWGIYIYMTNGDIICRKVTGITDQADSSYVYLGQTIAMNIYPKSSSLNNHLIIGRMLVGNFDQNQILIDFESQGIGTAPLKLKENYREYESWTPIEGVRYWEVKDQVQGYAAGCPASYTTYRNVGTFYNTFTSYPFQYYGYYWYHIFVYFWSVDIPNSANINRCTVTFVCGGDSAPYRGIDYDLSWANADTAPSFGESVGAFINLAKTTSVRWYVPTGTQWIEGDRYDTIDFSLSLQEVVDRPGWASGNNLLFCALCRNNQVGGWATKSWRSPYYYTNYGVYTAPRLKVEWV
jgi:hypothetical protein